MRYWIAGKLINFGIRLLDIEYQKESMIHKLIKTGHIRVELDVSKVNQYER